MYKQRATLVAFLLTSLSFPMTAQNPLLYYARCCHDYVSVTTRITSSMRVVLCVCVCVLMHIVLAPGECRAGGLIRFVIIKKRACERTATRNKTSNIVSVRSIVLYNKSTIRTKTGSRTHSRYTLLLYLHKVHIHLRKFQVEKKTNWKR